MRFPIITNPEDSETKELYQEIVDSGFGMEYPINWFTSQSIRPDILKSTWALTKGILVEGQLPATVRQMIAMAISKQNSCRYCEVTHTGALGAMGVPQEQIISCASDPEMADVPSPHREIIQFAIKAAGNPNSITTADYETLREVGVTNEEIMEAGMMAAFTNFINTWADLSGIPVDGESE